MTIGIDDIKLDIPALIDRIKDEAENIEDMATMLKAEINAYVELMETKEPNTILMYDKVKEFPNADYVAVGEIFLTDEDYIEDIYGYIIPFSYMEEGVYKVEYKLVYNM